MNSHGNIRKWLSSFWYFVRLIMYALAGIKFQMMFLLCMMNPTVLLTWTSRGSNESGHILKRRINETLVLCQILSSLKLQKGTTIKTFQISVANFHFFHFLQKLVIFVKMGQNWLFCMNKSARSFFKSW